MPGMNLLMIPALLAVALGSCGGAASTSEEEMNRMTPELADRALGLTDGRLSPCPDMPNCVCSQHAEDADHHIAPFETGGDPAAAWGKLQVLLGDTPRVELLKQEPTYLQTRFKTAIFRFEDDVEFLLDADAGVIHVRSASRLGHSDLGKNRKRVEALREKLGA